jgi:hypothetical protein
VHAESNVARTKEQCLQAYEHHFCPTKLFNFPKTLEFGKHRSFQLSWLERFKWLVYSPSQDGAYCKACVLFGQQSCEKNAQKLDKLVKSPIKFWTTACQKFRDHETKSQVHRTSLLRANEFIKVMKNQTMSVDQQLSSAVAEQIAMNRKS